MAAAARRQRGATRRHRPRWRAASYAPPRPPNPPHAPPPLLPRRLSRGLPAGPRLPAHRAAAAPPPRALLGPALDAALAAAAAAPPPSALDRAAAALATSLFLAGADPAAAAGAAAGAADATAAAAKGGFFAIFAGPIEAALKIIDGALDRAGVPYSYGFAIIAITLAVKAAAFPLSQKQVESTLAMQALAPRVKALQAKFAADPERLQVETARLYQTAGVNPLAGCLPTLATIPVFIGLYRALSNVADEGLLTEGFFWIPSLAGPVAVNGGTGWLSLVDGAPPLGWADTAKYLALPVALVVSQFLSQKIISPPPVRVLLFVACIPRIPRIRFRFFVD
jgi:YidC/Oxa1 family membrane protein insertase